MSDVQAQLVTFIDEYFQAFGPVPMRVLAVHFGKYDFVNTIRNLRVDGKIRILINARGNRLVCPIATSGCPYGYIEIR